MEYTLKVADIAEQTKIPESSVRRYLRQFNDFITSKRFGRATVYSQDVVPLITRIGNLYTEGKSTTEIFEILKRDTPITISPDSTEAALAPTTYTTIEQFTEFQHQVEELTSLLELILSRTEQLETHDSAIQAIQREVIDTKAQLNESINKLHLIDQITREQDSIGKRFDEITQILHQTTATIEQQNETIIALNHELATLREAQSASPSPIQKLKKMLNLS